MTNQCHRIICASAGTGKTYRLSLEYIALLLQYYRMPGFSIDNILALTFTRKATAEIRDRILAHLELLLSTHEALKENRKKLIQNLRKLVPESSDDLSLEEKNMLLSANREISCDQSRLQVMTIDAYIGNIFRNIVRPLRNIETFEIDTQAIEKRMPFLMSHLMQPEFRNRLNKLLSRKVSRSLDDYSKFFASLIRQRWLFYMITQRLQASNNAESKGVPSLSRLSGNEDNNYRQNFCAAMATLLNTVHGIWQSQQKYPLEDYFNAEFKSLFPFTNFTIAALMQALEQIPDNPHLSEKLLNTLEAKSPWNGNKIRSSKYVAETETLTEAKQKALQNLADYLMIKLYLPEQKEIIELWKIILQEYDRLIYRYKNMTYDDISWFSFEALFSDDPPFLDPQSEVSATEFYQFLSHRTRFLLIDEFQDTSLIQFNILKPIIEEITSGEGSKPFGGLIVVGDEKQSIFGWRGGERELLLNLTKIFPSLGEVTPLHLKECWRCGFSLMSFINRLFKAPEIHSYLNQNSMNWSYQEVSSANAGLEPETEVEFCLRNYSKTVPGLMRSHEIYADFVLRMVVPAIKEDPSGSIAILCRKGSELQQVQQALDENGIVSLYQPDLALILHPLVSPLLDWLRFVAWGDYSNLLGFLRSDYLRINTRQLKTILDIIASANASGKGSNEGNSLLHFDTSLCPWLNTLLNLAEAHKSISPVLACRQIVELCLTGKDKSERDYLNLHKFLSLITDWEINESSKLATIPDFLQYLQENAASEDNKQAAVSAEDSLQLLTIHKSKGLQFKRVFVFYNLSSQHREDGTRLSWAVQYAGQDYHQISDFGISYHYPKILKASSYRYLWDTEKKRELLEEMNNLYVALTRAESKLHLYFCYESKDTWSEYYLSKLEKSLPAMLCNACVDYFADKPEDSRGIRLMQSEFRGEIITVNAAQTTSPTDNSANIGSNLVPNYKTLLANMPQSTYPALNDMQIMETNTGVNWKKVWLEQQANLLGDLAHYYLSFIIRNEPNEHNYALRRCLAKYGSILPVVTIQIVMQNCRNECDRNSWLFAPEWNLIYTEMELKGTEGLLRIDRLMLNTVSKKAMIVDYKSGDVYDQFQLEHYGIALQKIKALQDFRVDKQIVKLETLV
ncbi:MAG: UvrD-helicase domain-containing protein [Candidatus Cloacimonetes bacterium]|nr:UvrD-helicase domain-containing protein [Candidatus Cloacimonadota bacterium]